MSLMVDGVLIVALLEAILFVALGRAAMLTNLAAGIMLLVAMRLVIADAGLPWIGLSLLAAGVAHLIDLRGRVL